MSINYQRNILLGGLTLCKIVAFYVLKEVMTSEIGELTLNSMGFDEYVMFIEDGISEDNADFYH